MCETKVREVRLIKIGNVIYEVESVYIETPKYILLEKIESILINKLNQIK